MTPAVTILSLDDAATQIVIRLNDLQRIRGRIANDPWEPCEFERSRQDYIDSATGQVPVRRYYCFHWMERGRRQTCPYPARFCRPKQEGDI